MRLLGEASTKREVMPKGSGMGGRSFILARRQIRRVHGKVEGSTDERTVVSNPHELLY